MRNCGLLAMLLIIGSTLTGCNLTGQLEPSIEMIAFNSLSGEEQDLIPVSPKDSIVEKITVSDEIRHYMGSDYKEQVYSVAFNNTKAGSGGELTVFVALDKKTVVGKGFVDR